MTGAEAAPANGGAAAAAAGEHAAKKFKLVGATNFKV